MREGQLYVIGRLDDLIIVRGLNHYPQDIEATARRSHPLLEAGYGAAFVVDDHGRQRLVLVQEVTRKGEADFTPVLDAVRKAVLDEHGLALHTIVLVRSGTIPKTSSGKIQRRACRTAFLAGELKALAEYRGAVENATRQCRPAAEDAASSSAHPAPHSSQSALAAVCQHALALGGAALSDVTPDTPLTALGLDSLQRVELAATLEKTFACHLPDTEFNPAQTLGDLAHAVQKHLIDRSRLDVPAGQIPPAHYDFARFPEYGELKRYERMLKAVGDNPYFRVDQGGAGSITHMEGRDLVNFCVYDYVGMAHDPEVAAAAKTAIDRYGTSAGASRLVSGEKQVHRDLEQALASFLGTAAAIVFVSGHATNVTTIGHLLGSEDLILHDVLAHNSIIQGASLPALRAAPLPITTGRRSIGRSPGWPSRPRREPAVSIRWHDNGAPLHARSRAQSRSVIPGRSPVSTRRTPSEVWVAAHSKAASWSTSFTTRSPSAGSIRRSEAFSTSPVPTAARSSSTRKAGASIVARLA